MLGHAFRQHDYTHSIDTTTPDARISLFVTNINRWSWIAHVWKYLEQAPPILSMWPSKATSYIQSNLPGFMFLHVSQGPPTNKTLTPYKMWASLIANHLNQSNHLANNNKSWIVKRLLLTNASSYVKLLTRSHFYAPN